MSPLGARHIVLPFRRRRYFGTMLIVVFVSIVAGVYVSLIVGIRQERIEAFDHIERPPYIVSSDPIDLVERGLPPNSSQAEPKPPNRTVRAIIMLPGEVRLLVAGQQVRRITLSAPITEISELVGAVDDPTWIETSAPRQVALKAALIVRSGVELRIGAPTIDEVQLYDTTSVFIGTRSGQLDFDNVTVRTVSSGGPDEPVYQPFVMAADGAVMHASASNFLNLGWDWNASYGTSWTRGSTGTVKDSRFNDGFIGVYTSEVTGVTFQRSEFNGNMLYGLDPHTFSTNLTVDTVLAERNGAHGIIFSDNVTDSVVKNSVSRFNGENGIMMDAGSSNNVIENNHVYNNTGDGLVTAASPYNTFVGNLVEGNRIGIRIDPEDASVTIARANRLNLNGLASENINLEDSNISQDNGGQANWAVLQTVWLYVAGWIIGIALLIAIYMARPQRKSAPSSMVRVRR